MTEERLTRHELIARADAVARDLLGTSREYAFGRLLRGELRGTLAEPELRMLYDLIERAPGTPYGRKAFRHLEACLLEVKP